MSAFPVGLHRHPPWTESRQIPQRVVGPTQVCLGYRAPNSPSPEGMRSGTAGVGPPYQSDGPDRANPQPDPTAVSCRASPEYLHLFSEDVSPATDRLASLGSPLMSVTSSTSLGAIAQAPGNSHPRAAGAGESQDQRGMGLCSQEMGASPGPQR